MSLLLAHEADFHFRHARSVFEILAVVIATNSFGFESERSDGAAELVDVVRSYRFSVVPQQQRPRQVQTLQRAAGDLIEIVFFLEQRVWRDVLERQAIFPQAIA